MGIIFVFVVAFRTCEMLVCPRQTLLVIDHKETGIRSTSLLSRTHVYMHVLEDTLLIVRLFFVSSCCALFLPTRNLVDL